MTLQKKIVSAAVQFDFNPTSAEQAKEIKDLIDVLIRGKDLNSRISEMRVEFIDLEKRRATSKDPFLMYVERDEEPVYVRAIKVTIELERSAVK